MGRLVEYRFVIALAGSAAAGIAGLHAWPFPSANVFLAMIAAERPAIHTALAYTYATVWFLTPFFGLNVVFSALYIFAARWDRSPAAGPLPAYPDPKQRDDLYLVLGEQHLPTVVGRAPEPRWLTIPERGLYTGIAIVGAIGTGKTSACMYPYIEQLLAYRSADPARRVGGLVLEVKGDFCQHVRDILERHGRGDDYVEVSLTSKYRYNPLHNDLDAYALAYGIATLMTNLFGRGKEPFWQQASTNLLKFVILLHQTLDGYVTLFQVYEHAINPDMLRARIAEGETRFGARNRRVIVDKREPLLSDTLQPWRWHDVEGGQETWTRWSQDLVDALAVVGIAHCLEADDGRRTRRVARRALRP